MKDTDTVFRIEVETGEIVGTVENEIDLLRRALADAVQTLQECKHFGSQKAAECLKRLAAMER